MKEYYAGQITRLCAGDQFIGTPDITGTAITQKAHKTKATPKDRQCGNTKPVQINRYPAGGQNQDYENQPFGSMPRCCSSLRIIRFIQAETEASPSCANACFIPASNSGSTRNAICLLPFPLILMVDIWLTPNYLEMVIKCMTSAYQKATPRSVPALPRRLTTNVKHLTR
ncbi:hypothetical protein MU985_003456 [Salmonella enterica]|nr:hypothetical protein [Salmonella enterica]EJA5819005.1 hypothetical protein [Salmonella enterica]EJA5856036.1 hypothetical protein [Salmonella enterica]EJF5729435.1 hypothetical protein [Salmonella enterica]EJX4302978.1 hypothetical protein [Salmonella enterica]